MGTLFISEATMGKKIKHLDKLVITSFALIDSRQCCWEREKSLALQSLRLSSHYSTGQLPDFLCKLLASADDCDARQTIYEGTN
jgi:hypothetical protein